MAIVHGWPALVIDPLEEPVSQLTSFVSASVFD